MNLEERFAGQMGRLLGPEFPPKIGLAVSGGGDSMAMLALAHGWARKFGVRLSVATIDHGLRPGSGAEAAIVAEECAALGHKHDVLRWHWNGQGNLQDAARRARLKLLGAWRGDIDHILYAHTRDDQAETLLMRLIRGSGVDGLAAMTPRREETDASGTWFLVRPLLDESRADLRHYNATLKVPFANDPTNDDPSYDRVRVRQAMRALELDHAALASTAHRMRRALGALQARAVEVAKDVVGTEDLTGSLLFDRDRFAQVERDTQLRLLAAALQWVTTELYRPRSASLDMILDRVLAGGGGTLHGAQIAVERAQFRVMREFQSVKAQAVELHESTIWDGRWQVVSTDEAHDGAQVRALGSAGLSQITDLPPDLPPRVTLEAVPALFRDDTLLASHLSQNETSFSAQIGSPFGSFAAFLESR